MTLFKTLSVLLVLVGTCYGARHLSSDDTVVLPVTVNLGTAGNYVILAQTGISTVPTSVITGDVAVSPISAAALTGFSLIADSSGTFSTSTQLTGKAFAATYVSPTPSDLTTAVGDMQTAYTEAAGRTQTSENLYSGLLGGQTLYPGVHTFNTDILVATQMYFNGTEDDIFVIQTTGTVKVDTAVRVTLIQKPGQTTYPQPKNIIWQVAGQVIMEAGSHMEGTLLVKTAAVFKTKSSLNGRVLAQTAVTLEQATITQA